MRKWIPAFMGLALALGTAGGVRASDDKYKEKTKAKVEDDGDVKIKSKVKHGDKETKTRTKIDKQDDGDVKVKSKTKVKDK